MVARPLSDPGTYSRVRINLIRQWARKNPAIAVPLIVVAVVVVLYTLLSSSLPSGHPQTRALAVASGPPRPARQPTTRDGKARTRRLQILRTGGIPKEGLGSSIGFMRTAGNLAYLLDADYIISMTALMFDYRASEIVNKGLSLKSGGRVCDIMEVILHNPSDGHFQERMDRAQSYLDRLYQRGKQICQGELPEDTPLLDEYALKELDRCDTLVINDYRIVGGSWSPCNRAWWQDVIDSYQTGPRHGNDIAIHFRWGDMYHVAQKEDKWKLEMAKVAPLVNIIREENPSVVVNVYMKPSRENESERRMRQILQPLAGEYNIIESSDDVEELSMMAQARYLFINAGSFSTAAAASGHAQVVVHNNGGAHHTLAEMRLKHIFSYDDIDLSAFRSAVKP